MHRVRASLSTSVSMNASGLVIITMCISRIADTRSWGRKRRYAPTRLNVGDGYPSTFARSRCGVEFEGSATALPTIR